MINKIHYIKSGNVGPTIVKTFCGFKGYYYGTGEFTSAKCNMFSATRTAKDVTCIKCRKYGRAA